MPFNSKAIVLIFANSAETDAARKGIAQSSTIFECLNAEIINKVKKTGLQYIVYNEELQMGRDFGTRLTTAFKTLFSKGFDYIITVGNDTPQLTTETLLTSYENLIAGKTVIGPSNDGGIYLLGIHRNRFEPAQFRELPWEQNTLFQESARFFLRRGMLHQLPRLTDIDSLRDIKTIIANRKDISLKLFRLLLSFLRKRQLYRAYRNNAMKSTTIDYPFNKGSPDHIF